MRNYPFYCVFTMNQNSLNFSFIIPNIGENFKYCSKHTKGHHQTFESLQHRQRENGYLLNFNQLNINFMNFTLEGF